MGQPPDACSWPTASFHLYEAGLFGDSFCFYNPHYLSPNCAGAFDKPAIEANTRNPHQHSQLINKPIIYGHNINARYINCGFTSVYYCYIYTGAVQMKLLGTLVVTILEQYSVCCWFKPHHYQFANARSFIKTFNQPLLRPHTVIVLQVLHKCVF